MNTKGKSRIPITTAGGIDGAVEVFVGILVVGMFSLLSVQIFFRYVLNNSIMWAEEVVRYMFAWMIFLGAAVNVRRRGHIVIEMIVGLLPPRFRRSIEALVHVQLFIVFVAMTYKGAEFTYMSRYTQSMALDIPLSYLYGVVPIAFALMTRSHIQLVWKRYFPGDVPSAPGEIKENTL